MNGSPSRLPSRDLVLIGAGHTNLHVVRMWRMQPIPDVRLTLISQFSRATYSGMLPGTLAGLYGPDDMQIDLWRFCESCGCRLIVAEGFGLNLEEHRIVLADRPPVRFDVASIGIGSVPAEREVWANDPRVISIKPMTTFLSRLEAVLESARAEHNARPLDAVIVGAGAGGVEITCGLDAWLASRNISRRMTLVDANPEILRGYSRGAVQRVRRELQRRGIAVRCGQSASPSPFGGFSLQDGSLIPADFAIWAAGAAPPPVFEELPLPKAADGFLAIRDTLQSTGSDRVFAVGDSATLVSNPFPKAGVYAVREGPILWENVQRIFSGRELIRYRPQRGFLSLLSVGDGRAVLDYHGLSAEGRWVWRLKDHIDRKFMRMYQDYSPRMAAPAAPAPPNAAMRCAGCGGKVGANVLSAALERLHITPDERTRRGLDVPDDAAVLNRQTAPVDVLSVDFFEAFLDDPYLVGRVAAVHALSDIWAMGALPLGAMTMATLPAGESAAQAELLYQVLAGGLRELAHAGASLWGGHTTEASEWTVGFTVAGQLRETPLTKSGLRPGDKLIVTKSLGTGVLLAAQRLCRCRAEWMDSLIPSLLRSNAQAAQAAREFGVRAATDVTGFGLAGHLFEMLHAGGVSATLKLSAIPLLDGFASLSSSGIRSSLDPSNRSVEPRIHVPNEAIRQRPEYAALFDPQTSGGLLLGVPADAADQCLARLIAAGDASSRIIGEVTLQQEWTCRVDP